MLLNDLIAKQGQIASVSPTNTARDAAEVMAEAHVGCVAVMEADRLVGILTERDLVRRVIVKNLDVNQVLVSDVMTKDVILGNAKDSLASAAIQMRQTHIRHLPVMDDDGNLLGVVSIRDLLSEEVQDMRDYIAQREG